MVHNKIDVEVYDIFKYALKRRVNNKLTSLTSNIVEHSEVINLVYLSECCQMQAE